MWLLNIAGKRSCTITTTKEQPALSLQTIPLFRCFAQSSFSSLLYFASIEAFYPVSEPAILRWFVQECHSFLRRHFSTGQTALQSIGRLILWHELSFKAPSFLLFLLFFCLRVYLHKYYLPFSVSGRNWRSRCRSNRFHDHLSQGITNSSYRLVRSASPVSYSHN